MSSSSEDTASYFFALLTLIITLPLILLTYRYWRKAYGKSDRFEIVLEKKAIVFMKENREDIVKKSLEEHRNSFRQKSTQFLSENLHLKTELLGEGEGDEDIKIHFQHLLRQGHTFWGIPDTLLNNGKVGNNLMTLPVGLYEDFIFTICNSINPLTFIFASEKHPQPMISRFITYCTAQTFVLFLYFTINDPTIRYIIGYLFAPITMLLEYWLNMMLVCPCLPEPERSSSKQDEKTNEPPSSKHIANQALYHSLRLIGWLLAFPILLLMITSLVFVAILIAKSENPENKLGKFVLDGILVPFILKVLIVSIQYLWFIHPTHITICGIHILTINSWTESQTNEIIFRESMQLSEEERKEKDAERKRAGYSEVDLCHISCYCIRCVGHSSDTHYTIDICRGSCYWTRCCDACVAWYWEEKAEVEKLIPSPVRHSFASPEEARSNLRIAKVDNNKQNEMIDDEALNPL